jgi:hypothetical protein
VRLDFAAPNGSASGSPAKHHNHIVGPTIWGTGGAVIDVNY